MERIFGLIFILSFTQNLSAQTATSSKDSINLFYDSLFKTLKSDYLYKDDVDWSQLENESKSNLNQYTNFKSSLAYSTVIFDKIKGTHCNLFYGDTAVTATYPMPTENDFSEQFLMKFSSNPSFEVKVIDDQYGYILIPGLNFEDVSPESIHNFAQPMYDQIADLKLKYDLKGWVVDLRFNVGGNSYPMLLALYDLLGDNVVAGGLDLNKKLSNKIRLDRGKYIDNEEVISYIKPKGKRMDHLKVAIITGIITASSGEIVAMSFKGRTNTLFIGEPTFGFTTGNEKKDLPFGAFMAITVAQDCDRNGNMYDKIQPDILVSKQDNFDDLSLDKNIQEAINWMNQK